MANFPRRSAEFLDDNRRGDSREIRVIESGVCSILP
jgi:hypothetical protein